MIIWNWFNWPPFCRPLWSLLVWWGCAYNHRNKSNFWKMIISPSKSLMIWQKGTYSLSNYTALCVCNFMITTWNFHTLFYYGDLVLGVNFTAKDHSVRKLWALKVEKLERLYCKYSTFLSDKVTHIVIYLSVS